MSLVLLLLGRLVLEAVTSDQEVATVGTSLLPAVLLNILAGIVVQCGTGGIITSQGRTKLVTLLSMGFELPLSLGSTIVLVLVFKASVVTVYWVQAFVTLLEALVVGLIVSKSDWPRFAREARKRARTWSQTHVSPYAPSTHRQDRGGEFMGQVTRRRSSRYELIIAIREVSWSGHELNRLPGLSSVVVQLTLPMSVSWVGDELTSLMAVSWFAC